MENKENEQEQVITPEQEVEKDNTAAETASAAEETQDSKEAELKWDSADDLAKKLEETEKKLADMEKLRLLALAETENQRKRFSKELEALRNRAIQDTMLPFLQVFDHFTMAVRACEGDNVNVATITQGMNMIQSEFDKAFSDVGVTLINAEGAVFDPNFHEAMAEEASETVPAGTVIRQWCSGCRMGDRLLKPAMVVVSSGPAAKEETSAEETAEKA